MKTIKEHLLEIILTICLVFTITTNYISNNNFKKLEKAYTELNEEYSKLKKYKVLDDTLNITTLRDSEVKIDRLIKYSNSKLFKTDPHKIFFTLLTAKLQLLESNIYLNNIKTITYNKEIEKEIDNIINK